MRVLLALNQSNTRMIEKLILGGFSPGDDVACVSDQAELLGMVVSRPPDVLIYNRYFPGDMPVTDALKAIKQSSPRTRIIFLAGQLDQKAWADCAAGRMLGIKDIVAWEKGAALPGSDLQRVVLDMVVNPRMDADNKSLDRMLESLLGTKIRRPRVYVFGQAYIPDGIDRADMPGDADLIIASGDREDAARFFAGLDCQVPLVMVSDFADTEVTALAKSDIAAIRPVMLDAFLRKFFSLDGPAESTPQPIVEAVQAAKRGVNIKEKLLGIVKKWFNRPERPSENPPLPEGFVALGHIEGVLSFSTVKEVVEAKPRAVLVPGIRGIKELRREKALSAVPIVVVGAKDPSVCMAAGADECIPGLDSKSVNLVLARAAQLRERWAQSEVDGLTECYTRRFLDSYAMTEHRPAAVLMCDLDHFKAVNDTYGHIAGDVVLKEFGRFLRDNVRGTDIVARYGGEEFVVIFALAENGIDRAETLCHEWATRRIKLPDGQVISSTFSGGFATGSESLTTLIGAADQALYQAKRAGRNRVAGERAEATGLVDRVASVIGEFTVLASLTRDGRGYRVTEARGPFAGQLTEELVEIIAEDGVHVHSGSHWLFGLSGETVLAKRGDVAVLVGRRGKFAKSDLAKLKGVF